MFADDSMGVAKTMRSISVSCRAREALLQLYNALNGTDYKDASELEVVTIESAVYIVMKNDLAMHCLLQWREKYA